MRLEAEVALWARLHRLAIRPAPRSLLPWQAVIRQKAGTDTGDNRVGGRREEDGNKNGSTEEESRRGESDEEETKERRGRQEWERGMPGVFVLQLCTRLNEISLAVKKKKCHTREFRSHENRLARRLPGPVCVCLSSG